MFITTKWVLCLTALSVSPLMAASLQATKTESFDWGWKFARFGKMPDGSTLPEPGQANGNAVASSEEGGNPASHAIDGDKSTRWCAASGSSGETLTLDMGQDVDAKQVKILWEKTNKHQFKLESSLDGKKWVVLDDKTKADHRSEEDSVAVKGKARYFRIISQGNDNSNWASIREVTVLNGQGEAIKPIQKAEQLSVLPQASRFNDKAWRSLNLPHDWGIEGPYRMELENETGKLPWVGIGWYRKQFTVPTDAQGNQFYLDFDGVMSRPKVYVNGELAGEWKYGYNSFRIDITPFLKFGQANTVAVRVDNPPNSSRWYPGGGIYRHVWLVESNPVHIANWGVYVRTPEASKNQSKVLVDTTVLNTTDKAVEPSVTEEVLTKSGKVVATVTTAGKSIAPGEKGIVASSLEVKKPQLWDTTNPYLYTLKTTVKLGDEIVDVKTTRFGIRNIEWKPEGFFLNGRKVVLNGVCQHHDLGPLGGAVHKRGYERQIQILKEMGVNSIRTSHNPPAPEFLDLCDENGILVIDELFDMWREAKKGQDYHLFFNDWHEKDLINFVHRDRNHPSIILWSAGNEVPEQGSSTNMHLMQQLSDLFHREDNTRPTTAGCNNEGAANNAYGAGMDVYGYNYKPWAYKGFTERYPNKPFYSSESASCVSSRGEYFFPASWDKNKGAYLYQVSSYDLYAPGWAYRPDIEFAALDAVPNCAGEYVWTGFDYLGEPTPYNLDATNALNVPPGPEREKLMADLKKLGDKAPSRSSYFGIVDLCGFKKDRFYLYQARWLPDHKMAHILPHWNWPERKGQVTPVHVYSSGDRAELFLNGKSLGVREKGKGAIDRLEMLKDQHPNNRMHQVGIKDNDRYRFVWDDVKYEPGQLKVVVTKDGKPWATDIVQTTGPATSLKLMADRKVIQGDGRDLSYVTVEVTDAKGRMNPRAKNELTFKVSGPAEIVGICNGDPTDFTVMSNPEHKNVMKIKAFNGLAQVILRSKKGETGKVTLQAIGQGLSGAKTEIKVN